VLAATWHSAHIHHHDKNGIDELILGVVQPVLAQLPADVKRCYFLRHWRRGPHVRVQVECSDHDWRELVYPLIERSALAYLREHPSSGHPNPAGEQRMHRQLAELEKEWGTLVPWHPDNSVRDEPYDRRLHVLGTDEAAELLARFHSDSTPLALGLLGEGYSQRLDRAVTLMFATAEAAGPPTGWGFLSYRSHAESYLAQMAEPARARDRLEAVYQANRGGLASRMTAAVQAARSQRECERWLADWLGVVRRYVQLVGELHAAGRLPLPDLIPADAAINETPNGRLSKFHWALLGNEPVRRELNDAAWFTIYRVILNYQYLLLTRVGIPAAQRYLLCYMAARTVENAYGITLDEMIESLSAPGASL